MRVIATLIALTVPISLAGCGGGQLNPTKSASSSIAGTSGTSAPSAPSGTNTSSDNNSGTSGSDKPSAPAGTSGTSGSANPSTPAGTGGTGGTDKPSAPAGTSGTSGSAKPSAPAETSGGSGSTTTDNSGESEPTGTVIANIHTLSWRSWGQIAPNYVDCSPSPCDGVAWSMKHGITTPSLSNNATEFKLGGTTPYGDVLFSAGIVGQNSKEIPDRDHKLLPTMHSFIYETDFYVTDVAITQSLEFDISLTMNGVGITWGTQCNNLNTKNWDIWDNAALHWVTTGSPCKMVNGWNHLTIRVQKKADNTVVYQSIKLNGTTYTLNKTSRPRSVPSGWWGLNANFQMDGNYKQSPNTVYLDNLSVTYM